jgi:hypothetical protein
MGINPILHPTATIINYVYTIKLHNNLGILVYHLMLPFHVRLVNQPTMMGATFCHKKVGCPLYIISTLSKYETPVS